MMVMDGTTFLVGICKEAKSFCSKLKLVYASVRLFGSAYSIASCQALLIGCRLLLNVAVSK